MKKIYGLSIGDDTRERIGQGGIPVKIVQVCAVYREWPIHLVVQNDAGEFLELSLKELKEADYEFDDHAWKQLVEDFRVFHHSYQ